MLASYKVPGQHFPDEYIDLNNNCSQCIYPSLSVNKKDRNLNHPPEAHFLQ